MAFRIWVTSAMTRESTGSEPSMQTGAVSGRPDGRFRTIDGTPRIEFRVARESLQRHVLPIAISHLTDGRSHRNGHRPGSKPVRDRDAHDRANRNRLMDMSSQWIGMRSLTGEVTAHRENPR